MSTIPLPALHVDTTQQQPNQLAQLAQILQLRNAQQNAPIQRQILAQQAQAGNIELQQQQQAQKDQLAFRAAMQDPSMQGKTIGQVAEALAQKGAISQAAWQGAMKADTEHQTSLANLTEKKLAAAKASHDQTQQLYNNVMNMPDDQVQANWPNIAQQYNSLAGQDGMKLDPNQPMTKQQLAQFGPMISMGNAYIDQEMARRKAKTEQDTAEANLSLKQAEGKYYAQNGGAPGISAETQELNSYLKNNPGKTAEDFIRFKAQNSPSVVVQNMTAGSGAGPNTDWSKVANRYGMTQAAFDQTAEKYFQTGQLPQIGRSPNAIAMNRDIMNRAAELHTGESLAASSAEYKANTESLKALQKNFYTVSAFEGTANKNIAMLEQLAQKVPDLGVKFANTPVRMISGNLIGSENMAAFKTALAPVQAEAAKILNSANLTGQLSDSSRHELQDLVNGNMPYKSLVASLRVLQQDFKNRHDTMQQQIEDIKTRLGGAKKTEQQSAPAAGGTDLFTQFGGKAHSLPQ